MPSTYRNIHDDSASSIHDEDEREVGLSLSRSLFSRSYSENFCHLFDIDDVDCLDEVYSMLLCRRIRLLLRRCIQKTAILTIILSASIYFSLSLILSSPPLAPSLS